MYFNSYYGNYRTRTFANIYPNFNTFNTAYIASGIPMNLLTGTFYTQNCSINTIYYLLISEYADAHVKSSDENLFSLRLFRNIYEYAPTWQRQLYIQNKVLTMADDEIITGSKAIYNHARNPSTTPSTAYLGELPFIDDQSTTNYKKNATEAYMEVKGLLETDFTSDFISKFAQLFIDLTYPDTPLLYVTEEN